MSIDSEVNAHLTGVQALSEVSDYRCEWCGAEILCHCGQDHDAHGGIAEDGCSPQLGHTYVPLLPCECRRGQTG